MGINLIETEKKKCEPSKKWVKINVMLIYVFSHISWTVCKLIHSNHIPYFVYMPHAFIRPSIRHYFVKCAFISILLSSLQNGKKILTFFYVALSHFSRFSDTTLSVFIFMCGNIYWNLYLFGCTCCLKLAFVKFNYFSNWKFFILGKLSPTTDQCNRN